LQLASTINRADLENFRMSLACSMGIMAYNEESNIGQLLQAVTSHQSESVFISEVVVVASGCTDNTQSIVEEWEKFDSRVRLIVQKKREGKASAINHFLAEARERIVVLCSADLLPAPGSIEHLVAPFADPEVGMTTGKPVPVNDPSSFTGFAAHLLWELHHQVNLTSFKAGEMIAIRKIFERIPYSTAVDEASMEPVIRGQGYEARYVPAAIVHNKGPETLNDFLSQRRRIYAGHKAVRDTLGYTVSTMSGWKVLKVVVRNLDWRPRPFCWTWAVAGLEVYARVLGARDYKNRRDHHVWEIAKTTKELKRAS